MSTATTLSKENNTLGLGLFNSQKTPQPFTESPNLLRLVPRALACKGNASVKRSAAPVFRQIQYEESGELEDFISQPQLGGKIYNLRDEFECITVDTSIDNDATPVADKNRPTTSCNGFTHVAAEEPCNGVDMTPKLIKSKSVENGVHIHPKTQLDSPANVVKASSFPNTNIIGSDARDQQWLRSIYSSCENQRPSTSHFNNGTPSRKRVLSDRCEQESQFPKVDRTTIFNTWDGCNALNGNPCASGLINPMNNCFLNSVLQAVVHLPHLARMILDPKDVRMCRKASVKMNGIDCFHCGLRAHIRKAIDSRNPLNTNWIQIFLRKIFPHHRHGCQEDAHEMLTLLLGALEIVPPRTTLNGLKVHGVSPSTPIEQIFGGNMRNQVVCNTCNSEHINYERIREMNLGLTRTYNADVVTLIDDFFKDEQLQNFFCSKCKKKQTATRHTFLLSAPCVLIIQIKRFNPYGGKNRTPVRANKIIDLTKHSFRQEHFVYQLHGLIQHIGGGLNFGHYICAMRGFNNRDMFLFDDSERKPIPLNYAMEKMEPYILFYTRYQQPNKQIKQIPRRSFEGCQPNYAKQPKIDNYSNNNNTTPTANSFIGTSKMFNQTFGSYIN
uniref:Ubiquitin carboxyl-terminal hydrolase 36 n=2 Tax=Meloidogyne incognita TaxID=6306 RepID=A0A914LJV5_MELIC